MIQVKIIDHKARQENKKQNFGQVRLGNPSSFQKKRKNCNSPK